MSVLLWPEMGEERSTLRTMVRNQAENFDVSDLQRSRGSGVANIMIRKLKSGEYRLYSRKKGEDGKRRNLGTFKSREAAEKHEREVQYFKSH